MGQSVTTVTWDGKNLAAIQELLQAKPRVNGRPCYEVDKDWNLTVHGIPVLPGQQVMLGDDGSILVKEPA